MIDDRDREHENTSDPSPDQLQGTYASQFEEPQQQRQVQDDEYYQQPLSMQPGRQQQMAPRGQFNQQPMMQTTQVQGAGGLTESYDGLGQVIDPDDPMLDADPFGLSASMHYPTSYTSMEQQAPQR